MHHVEFFKSFASVCTVTLRSHSIFGMIMLPCILRTVRTGKLGSCTCIILCDSSCYN